jgi:hypothetical protein
MAARKISFFFDLVWELSDIPRMCCDRVVPVQGLRYHVAAVIRQDGRKGTICSHSLCHGSVY